VDNPRGDTREASSNDVTRDLACSKRIDVPSSLHFERVTSPLVLVPVIAGDGSSTGNEVRLGAIPTTSAYSAEEGRDDDVYVGELGRDSCKEGARKRHKAWVTGQGSLNGSFQEDVRSE
jgi:hypothetical protein